MFRKKQPRLTPPQGMGRGDISVDRSICTGEAVIGFRDRITRELRCAVAVRCNESDVRPNVLAVFSGLDGEQSFSPRITLEDETLLSAPGVYTLIPR